jgi:hypothetical protein
MLRPRAQPSATRSGTAPQATARPAAIGEWSVKDVLAHLAAWRVEAADQARVAMDAGDNADADPAPTDPVDESNASTAVTPTDREGRRRRGGRQRRRSSRPSKVLTDVLCECDDGSVADRCER